MVLLEQKDQTTNWRVPLHPFLQFHLFSKNHLGSVEMQKRKGSLRSKKTKIIVNSFLIHAGFFFPLEDKETKYHPDNHTSHVAVFITAPQWTWHPCPWYLSAQPSLVPVWSDLNICPGAFHLRISVRVIYTGFKINPKTTLLSSGSFHQCMGTL